MLYTFKHPERLDVSNKDLSLHTCGIEQIAHKGHNLKVSSKQEHGPRTLPLLISINLVSKCNKASEMLRGDSNNFISSSCFQNNFSYEF